MLSRSSDLRELLTDQVLADLYENSSDFTWLSDEISENRTPELRKYLMEEIGIEEITPEKFAGRLNKKFLENRSDDWMIQFYRYLNGQRALWREQIKHKCWYFKE